MYSLTRPLPMLRRSKQNEPLLSLYFSLPSYCHAQAEQRVCILFYGRAQYSMST